MDLEAKLADLEQERSALEAKLRRQKDATAEARKVVKEREARLRATESRAQVYRRQLENPATIPAYCEKVEENQKLAETIRDLRGRVRHLERALEGRGIDVPPMAPETRALMEELYALR